MSSRATVSRRLAALNARLDAWAFERIDGTYHSTGAGRRLVAAALEMENAVYAAERKAMGLERAMSGRLTLSLPEALARHLLMEDLGRFADRFPEIQLVLLTSNNFANLDRREADVVVRVTHDPPDHLVGRRLFKYWRCQYCAASGSEDLRWLGWPDDRDLPDWVRDSLRPETPVGLRIEDPLVRHAAALAGLGLVFEACFLADPDPRLRRPPRARPRHLGADPSGSQGHAQGFGPPAPPGRGHLRATGPDRGAQARPLRAGLGRRGREPEFGLAGDRKSPQSGAQYYRRSVFREKAEDKQYDSTILIADR